MHVKCPMVFSYSRSAGSCVGRGVDKMVRKKHSFQMISKEHDLLHKKSLNKAPNNLRHLILGNILNPWALVVLMDLKFTIIDE